MAITMFITPGELERQANLAYEGKQIRVFCCSDPGQEIEITDNISTISQYAVPGGTGGYEDFVLAIPFGYYNKLATRYEIPPIIASFGAVEEGFTYDVVVVEIGNSNYPHSIIKLSEPQTLRHGQIKSYRIALIQDD